VRCLPVCTPPDPCDEKVDLCCVVFSGEDQPCSDVTINNGDPLCTLLINILSLILPSEDCCALEGTITRLDPPTPSVCGPCVLITNEADLEEQMIHYTDCNGVRIPVTLPAASIEHPTYYTETVCTNDINSFDLTGSSDIYYMVIGECSDGNCTKLPCKCYLIMNSSASGVNYSYLDCNYDINDPQLTTGGYVDAKESAYVCSVGIPSISTNQNDNNSGTTLPDVYVVPLDNLNCGDDECGTQTAYCHTLSATGSADVDYVYLNYLNGVDGGTVYVGEAPIKICAQPGSIIKATPGTLIITPSVTTCTGTGSCTSEVIIAP
jgi:hypothetical protein